MDDIQVGNVVPGAILLGRDERGINETFIGAIDIPSGRLRAYVKVLAGRQLVNELFSTTLGRALGLPIPEGFIVRARPSDLPESTALADHGNEALLFASRAQGSPDLKRRLQGDAEAAAELFAAWSDWDRCMTFDEWIANVDRHLGNILFGGPGDVWLIDHGHAFTGPAWASADLTPGGRWINKLAEHRIPELTLPRRAAARDSVRDFMSVINAVDVGASFEASHAPKLLASADATAMRDFVTSRIPHLYAILADRLGIPTI